MRAPVSWELFKKIVDNMIVESSYIEQCAKLGIDIFEHLHNEVSLTTLFDYLFQPENTDTKYDTFSWWFYESNQSKRPIFWYEELDGQELEHSVQSVEDIYMLLCSEKGCDCEIYDITPDDETVVEWESLMSLFCGGV